MSEDSSDSSDSSYSSDAVLHYDEYQDYKDLTPLPLPEQIPGFFEIKYTDDYKQLFGYFFALYTKQEYSQRALNLCNKVISKFCLHYSAWQYKQRILEHIDFDVKEVQREVETLIKSDTKIYQAWTFYEWLIDRQKEPLDPMPLLENVFRQEPKNFHAWSFVIWYAKRWNNPEPLYQLALYHIDLDARNNSAWSARMTLSEMLNKDPAAEFEDAVKSIREIPRNESVRNYLLGLCEKYPEFVPKLVEIANELKEKDPTNPASYRLLLHKATLDKNQEMINELCDNLIKYDGIRANYYNLLKAGTIQYM
ncbi:prenyltransferase alpha subunit, putative [Trichomonas vaginalis G3]|uniref:Protein farnesyltransferase/geranylgeranyltransferase type-1 subunit alpha n=1 Tax=Trichomonas vaginalis (strain ATCC PRA-98 / G3) TaxID=412133 RepID=A2F4E0_TRIV3|nr:CAAX-protein geranylgeranyltransferase protein [Trichomonas vaginalis G3]EAY00205.1 prenyltransferase alpha subunit, putative [Trichomonas vaginalis G3]KAI5492905.1 CAAX-protein geranylgeranyltransferase protein [Trichomonas vaginalis G3]|eukprot:XP_001313134.1 prenyltransferase alpha subunit [Trichomonas vaginalis G3]